jgi:hypothetical protein
MWLGDPYPLIAFVHVVKLATALNDAVETV